MADVKWIKMATSLPSNKKLIQLRTLPEGDTIALMWVFLMCLAGDVNEQGLIYITPEVPYTDEMLAEEFRMDINTIRLGLEAFQRFGMIEIIEDIICLPSWEKWQSVDKLSEIREYNRLAKQRSRAKQKQKLLECAGNVNDMSMTSQPCQGIEVDEDKEERKKIYISIVDYLNQKAGTKYKASSKKTQTCIHARLEEGFTFDDFKTVIDKKCADWLNDAKMAQYLRPETLFGTKFEAYLNAKVIKQQQPVNKGVPVGSSQDDLDELF